MEAKRRVTLAAGNKDLFPDYHGPHKPPVRTVKLSDIKLSSEEDMLLADAYVGLEQWNDALKIVEGFPSLPVATQSAELWLKGTIPGSSSDVDALCRLKLGLPALPPDPRIFKLGRPSFGFARGGSFTTTPEGLWIAGGDKLLQLDFNLMTNLDISLPSQGACPACVCAGSSQIYIATQGAGLIEFNKSTRQCRRWTEKDGLYYDFVNCLCLQGDTLWIGFGRQESHGGAVGRLDLTTGHLTAFTASASSLQSMSTLQSPPTEGPRETVLSLAAGPDGDMFVASYAGFQRYHAQADKWERLVSGWQVQSVVCNAKAVFVANFLSFSYRFPYHGVFLDGVEKEPQCGLQVQTLSDGKWNSFGETAAIPQPCATALALDGADVWLGGRGYIGVINPEQKTMRKFCYTHAAEVYHMEVAGDSVWSQLNGWLYRIPLSVAR
jgi:hypothetical protein